MEKAKEIPYGYCHCGCGQKTRIAKVNDKCNGTIKGKPKRYLNHHYNKGYRIIRADGRVLIFFPSHPRSDKKGYIFEHVLVAEQKLGRLLDPGEVVHHKDGNRGNNSPENLEVFRNNGEHISFHAQERVDWSGWGRPRKFDHDAAAKLYEEGGLSVAAVARKFGVKRQTMVTALRNCGIMIRPRGQVH
jgi:hypothetical protein